MGVDTGTLDLLAIGAHPDDVEIGAGGTLAALVSRGVRVGLVDLTLGELASNGTPEERQREAEQAGRELGLTVRWSAGLVEWPRDDGSALDELVGAIRRFRPGVLLAPHPGDPHPGHAWAARLAGEARYLGGLTRWGEGAPFRPRFLLHYFICGETYPSLVIDVSHQYGRKRAALAAHASQFQSRPGGTPTPLNTGAFLHMIEIRDRHWGTRMGVQFAEGFWTPEPVPMLDPRFLVNGGED
ncbi:MAG: bacillithiol biosynthesis deacetylase BshB1 [bacterium]|nr:bacillithiol biosynthesis deacetylase BshB1 [bacterium]